VWVELSGCWPFWPLLEAVGGRAVRARAASP
jgi:hypothetical protein